MLRQCLNSQNGYRLYRYARSSLYRNGQRIAKLSVQRVVACAWSRWLNNQEATINVIDHLEHTKSYIVAGGGKNLRFRSNPYES